MCVYERFNFHFEPNVLLEISSKETTKRKFTAFECLYLELDKLTLECSWQLISNLGNLIWWFTENFNYLPWIAPQTKRFGCLTTVSTTKGWWNILKVTSAFGKCSLTWVINSEPLRIKFSVNYFIKVFDICLNWTNQRKKLKLLCVAFLCNYTRHKEQLFQ